MKAIASVCQATVLATLVAMPVFADRDRAEPADLGSAFAGGTPVVEQLDMQAMEETRGRLPLLGIPLAITALDVTLMGFFWGIYVPYYGGGGTCNSCYIP